MSAENPGSELEGGAGAAWPPAEGSGEAVAAVAPQPAVQAEPVEAKPEAKVVSEEKGTPDAAHRQYSSGGEAYELEVPADVDPKYADHEVGEVVKDFAFVAHNAGLSQSVAQEVINSYVDAASMLGVDTEWTGDRDDATATLRGLWGANFTAMMDIVVANVGSLGEGFERFLDESGLGNNPAAICALANLADYQKSPAEAKRELDRLMSLKDYTSQDKSKRQPIVARVQTLSRIAARGTASPEGRLNAIARGKTPFVSLRASSEAASAAGKATDARDARAEVAAMMTEKNGPLMNNGHAGHAEAVKKYMALIAKL
jgi:hypothetical protein